MKQILFAIVLLFLMACNNQHAAPDTLETSAITADTLYTTTDTTVIYRFRVNSDPAIASDNIKPAVYLNDQLVDVSLITAVVVPHGTTISSGTVDITISTGENCDIDTYTLKIVTSNSSITTTDFVTIVVQ
jgi:hypothetical protein